MKYQNNNTHTDNTKTYRIEFNGKVFNTKFYHKISDDEFEYIREVHYQKPPYSEVQKQFISISNGGCNNGIITKYYVKDIMEKTKKRKSKFSVEEVFSSKDLVSFLYGKSLSNPNVYNSRDLVKNLETVCRIGGSGCVWAAASNFPMETVDLLIQKYNTNDVVYDFSCGWGSRMLGTIRNRVQYLGTDPNTMLVERLQQMSKDYAITTQNDIKVDIRDHGSEQYIPEWQNKIGLAFSSPPYYDEEDYIIGEQSYKPGMSYDEWIKTYLEPTIKNIYTYLINSGYFCINIKNIGKYKLEEDTQKIAELVGFKLFAIEHLKNHKRPHAQLGLIDNSEKIYVFKK